MHSLASCLSWIFDDALIHHPDFQSLMRPSEVQPEFQPSRCFEKTSEAFRAWTHQWFQSTAFFKTTILTKPSLFICSNIPTYSVWTAFWQPVQELKVPKRWDAVWVAIYFMFFSFWELSQNTLNVWPQTVHNNHCFLCGCRWRWMMSLAVQIWDQTICWWLQSGTVALCAWLRS